MKPSETLINAWCERLHHIRHAKIALTKACIMFRYATGDAELYRRADALTREARAILARADSEFRTAIRTEWKNRFRIEMIEWNRWRVWVREPNYNDERPLDFNKSTRPKYAPKRARKRLASKVP